MHLLELDVICMRPNQSPGRDRSLRVAGKNVVQRLNGVWTYCSSLLRGDQLTYSTT